MSHSFTKLFSSITESTVWVEPYPTRIAWVSMLANADRQGRIHASIPGLAKLAGITLPEVEAALQCFLSPDRYSRSKEHDGRRIEEIDGGWRLLNYDKYRELRDAEERREYQRQWDREHRPSGHARAQSSAAQSGPTRSDKSDEVRPAPTKAEAEAEAVKSKTLARGTRLPADWAPDAQLSAWVCAYRPKWTEADHRRVVDSFRDYWTAKAGRDAAKTDWIATFRNWVRREPESFERAANKALTTMSDAELLQKATELGISTKGLNRIQLIEKIRGRLG